VIVTKTGIEIPGDDDKYNGLRDAVNQLRKIIIKMAEVIDDMADDIEKLKNGVTVYATTDTDTDT